MDTTAIEEELSPRARAFRSFLEDPNRFPETCDSGDLGSPSSPSIWLFGMEPGYPKKDKNKRWSIEQKKSRDLEEYKAEFQQKWIFNRNAFKLLAELRGISSRQYKEFALRERPFEKGRTGYFKGNLFPVPCNNIGEWDECAQEETGFFDKNEYRAWVKSVRIPTIRKWIETRKPSVLLCSGVGYVDDFMDILQVSPVPKPHRFSVGDYTKNVFVGVTGMAPVVVVPHLSGGKNGLNSHAAVQEAARYIRDRLPGVF